MEDDDECKLNESFCCYTAAIVTYICLSKHLCVCVWCYHLSSVLVYLVG